MHCLSRVAWMCVPSSFFWKKCLFLSWLVLCLLDAHSQTKSFYKLHSLLSILLLSRSQVRKKQLVIMLATTTVSSSWSGQSHGMRTHVIPSLYLSLYSFPTILVTQKRQTNFYFPYSSPDSFLIIVLMLVFLGRLHHLFFNLLIKKASFSEENSRQRRFSCRRVLVSLFSLMEKEWIELKGKVTLQVDFVFKNLAEKSVLIFRLHLEVKDTKL